MTFVNPLAGVVTSGYSPKRMHPVLREIWPHWGTDIGGRPRGIQHPVGAIADGIVTAVRSNSYNGDRRSGLLPRLTGNGVIVKHADYYGRTLQSYYGHLSRVDVRVGQRVTAGQRLGLQGATGNVSGAHLHLEIWVAGRTVDPDVFMRKEGVRLGTGPTAPKAPVGPLPAPEKAPVTPTRTPWEELLDMFKNKADFQRFLDGRLDEANRRDRAIQNQQLNEAWLRDMAAERPRIAQAARAIILGDVHHKGPGSDTRGLLVEGYNDDQVIKAMLENLSGAVLALAAGEEFDLDKLRNGTTATLSTEVPEPATDDTEEN